MNAADRQIHVRYNGRSWDINYSELDLGDSSTDNDVKREVANYLDAPVSKLNDFVVDRSEYDLNLRPQATFGK